MTPDTQRNNVRDLALVIFGYTLGQSKEDREANGVIYPAELPVEIGKLVEALLANNNVPVRDWFESRDAAIQNGCSPTEAAAKAILRFNHKQKLASLGSRIQMAKAHSTPDLVAQLRAMADDLENTL